MNYPKDDISSLIAYNGWANERTLSAVRSLSQDDAEALLRKAQAGCAGESSR